MPVTIKPATLRYKDENGVYKTADCLAGDIESFCEEGPSRNGFYRGKNLGTITADNIDTFVSSHKIAEGKFTGLYLGDYFVIQDGTYNVPWMIAEFDKDYGYFKNAQNKIDTHRITVIPRCDGLMEKRMHSQEDTTVGIAKTELFEYVTQTLHDVFYAVLGTHLKNQRVNASYNVDESDVISLATGTIAGLLIPTEMEMFGTAPVELPIAYSADSRSKKILPVFRFINPGMYTTGDAMWMATIVAMDGFYSKTRLGGTSVASDAALSEYWVRPLMAIG